MAKEDPIKQEIKCECGGDDCDLGVLISNFPENKIKIQIISKENIMSVVIDKNKLMEKLNETNKS